MTPNLTRLFADTKIDVRETSDEHMKQHLRLKRNKAETDKYRLFEAHGEALIEALEKVIRFGELGSVQIEGRGPRYESKEVWQFPRHICYEIDQLLAQLESEAQPL